MATSPATLPTTTNGRRIHGAALVTVLTALMLTLLLEALDQTIVGTALPKIIGSLQGFDRYIWVATAYLLGSTTMIPIVGKLSDQFGRKWFLVGGVVLFLVGSFLSGAAQSMNQLIAFRAIQGLGAGTGIALVITVVGDIFPPAERAKWQGIFAAVYGFSSVVGPTIGGWLADHGPLLGTFITDSTRWRWVFYVNLPVGAIALAGLLLYLPADISMRSSRHTGAAALRHVDFVGAALASAATVCLLLGLTWGGNQTYAWGSAQVIGTLVGAAVLFAAFVITERFVAEPILPLDLFRNQVFAADSLLGLTSGMVLLGLVYYLPLYLQGILGESAANSGVVITPLTVSLVVGAAAAGIIIARVGRYQAVTLVGAAILTIGVWLMTTMSASTSLLAASRNMVIAGLGLGVFFSVVTLAVQNALPRTRLGVGTGAITYLRSVGQTLGVAIVGTVVNNTIATDIVKRIPASTAQQLTPAGLKYATDPQALISATYRDTVVHNAQQFAARAAAAQVPPGPNHDQAVQQAAAQAMQAVQGLLDQVFGALKLSLAVALQHGFTVVLVFCVGVIVAAIFLKDVPFARHFHEEPAGSNDAATNAPEAPAPVV